MLVIYFIKTYDLRQTTQIVQVKGEAMDTSLTSTDCTIYSISEKSTTHFTLPKPSSHALNLDQQIQDLLLVDWMALVAFQRLKIQFNTSWETIGNQIILEMTTLQTHPEDETGNVCCDWGFHFIWGGH